MGIHVFDVIVLLLFLLFVCFLFARFSVGSFLVVFLFVGCLLLVALGLEWGSFIGLQRDGENAVGGVVVKALIELADAGVKVARGNEIKIFAVVIEDRIVVTVKARRNLGDFLRSQRKQEYVTGTPSMRLGIGEPEAVGRPTAVANFAVFGLVDHDGFLVVETDEPAFEQLVPIEKFLAVRLPNRTVAEDAAIGGDVRFPAPHMRAC